MSRRRAAIPFVAMIAMGGSLAFAEPGAMKNLTSPSARIELTTRKPRYFLGENVLLDFCVRNPGSQPITIDVGGDYRGSSRSLRFKVEVRDAAGALMEDPDPDPFNLGGLGYSPAVKPGAAWCQSLSLTRYARIDLPGTYAITATHDLGWKGPTPVGKTTVTLVMPDAAEAERVIAEMESLPTDPSTSAGQLDIPYQDFSTLRYDIYVAPLVARAQNGSLPAIAGLAEIPTTNATRALVALLGHANREVARAAAAGLAMRLPDPALDGKLGPRNPFENNLAAQRRYLSTKAWSPAFADAVRAAARARLAAGEVRDEEDGAFMLEAVGTPDDGPALTSALDSAIERTRHEPAEKDIYPVPRGACQELLRAADVLVARGFIPDATPKNPGALAIWLVALKRGARPSGWEAEVDRAFHHEIAYIRQLALDSAPDPLPSALVPSVAANLANPDEDVVVAAAQLAERARLVALVPQISSAMSRMTGIRLDIVSNSARVLGASPPRSDGGTRP